MSGFSDCNRKSTFSLHQILAHSGKIPLAYRRSHWKCTQYFRTKIRTSKNSILKCQTLNAYLTGCQQASENKFQHWQHATKQCSPIQCICLWTVAAVDKKKYVTLLTKDLIKNVFHFSFSRIGCGKYDSYDGVNVQEKWKRKIIWARNEQAEKNCSLSLHYQTHLYIV